MEGVEEVADLVVEEADGADTKLLCLTHCDLDNSGLKFQAEKGRFVVSRHLTGELWCRFVKVVPLFMALSNKSFGLLACSGHCRGISVPALTAFTVFFSENTAHEHVETAPRLASMP